MIGKREKGLTPETGGPDCSFPEKDLKHGDEIRSCQDDLPGRDLCAHGCATSARRNPEDAKRPRSPCPASSSASRAAKAAVAKQKARVPSSETQRGA